MADRWSQPSRSDYYLMQIALKVAQSAGSKERDLNKMKIPFKDNRPKIKRKLTKADLERMSQEALQRWIGRLGK